jgi:hypothetical protein
MGHERIALELIVCRQDHPDDNGGNEYRCDNRQPQQPGREPRAGDNGDERHGGHCEPDRPEFGIDL